MKNVWIVVIVLIVLIGAVLGIRLLSGDEDTWICEDGQWIKHGNPTAAMPTEVCEADALDADATDATEESAATGIANPASTYCVEQGGTVEIRTGEDGGQIGYCVFEDGQECEEWDYFNGECTVN